MTNINQKLVAEGIIQLFLAWSFFTGCLCSSWDFQYWCCKPIHKVSKTRILFSYQRWNTLKTLAILLDHCAQTKKYYFSSSLRVWTMFP